MKLVIYPGTFDPITNGHLDIIQRAVTLFDQIIVAVTDNLSKQPLFSREERVQMIQASVSDLPNVTVDSFQGLLVDYAKRKKAGAVLRGLRATLDFEYEFQMALINRKLAPEISTIFLMTHERYAYLNSTIVKELARFGTDVSCFIPSIVQVKLKEKFAAL